MVMKRASIEPNFHTLYSSFLETLGNIRLFREVLAETYSNIRILLGSDKGIANFSDRSLLKNLGHWLGLITLARNVPILMLDLDIKPLVVEAYHNGQQELLYVVPFVAKVLESCAKSKVFRPPCPWTMGIMNLLAELHQEHDLKLNLKFEIEVLCKNLGIELSQLRVGTLLKDHDKLNRMLNFGNNFGMKAPPPPQPGSAAAAAAAAQQAAAAGGIVGIPGMAPGVPGMGSAKTAMDSFASAHLAAAASRKALEGPPPPQQTQQQASNSVNANLAAGALGIDISSDVRGGAGAGGPAAAAVAAVAASLPMSVAATMPPGTAAAFSNMHFGVASSGSMAAAAAAAAAQQQQQHQSQQQQPGAAGAGMGIALIGGPGQAQSGLMPSTAPGLLPPTPQAAAAMGGEQPQPPASMAAAGLDMSGQMQQQPPQQPGMPPSSPNLQRPVEPKFSFTDINTSNLNGISPHIHIDGRLTLLKDHPDLVQLVKIAIEKSIQAWVTPVIERAIKIALTTCEQIVKKDYALDHDESRVRAAAHHMVRNLTAGMAMITCRDHLLESIKENLQKFMVTLGRNLSQQQQEAIEMTVAVVGNDNVELACAFIQKKAIEKAVPEIDARLKAEYESRAFARKEGRRFCDAVALTYQAERMPEQVRKIKDCFAT